MEWCIKFWVYTWNFYSSSNQTSSIQNFPIQKQFHQFMIEFYKSNCFLYNHYSCMFSRSAFFKRWTCSWVQTIIILCVRTNKGAWLMFTGFIWWMINIQTMNCAKYSPVLVFIAQPVFQWCKLIKISEKRKECYYTILTFLIKMKSGNIIVKENCKMSLLLWTSFRYKVEKKQLQCPAYALSFSTMGLKRTN